jgi:PTH1 family peptidyl-tRNA hydrolase
MLKLFSWLKKNEGYNYEWMIIGLGNPGERYAETRHNIGFKVINKIAKMYNIRVNKSRYQAKIGTGNIEGINVVLAKPQTFVNLSGEAVKILSERYNILSERLIIIYDDIHLPVGKLRIRSSGSSGGHNGVQSIINHINTQQFPRIRIGIGTPAKGENMADYVLARFKEDEREIINNAVEQAVEAIATIITCDIQAAMNKYN